MASDADEHERALALEITFQRRQWDKMQRMEKFLETQADRLAGLEQLLDGQGERTQRLERQLELAQQEAQKATAEAARALTEEREARQREQQVLQAATRSYEVKCSEVVRETSRELSHALQSGHQELRGLVETLQRRCEDLARDLGSKCKDHERELTEERAARLQEHCSVQATLGGLAGVREEAERMAVREREARRKEHQELRGLFAGLERKCGDTARDTAKDLTRVMQSKHQECADLVRELAAKCKELGREAAEDREAWSREQQTVRDVVGDLEQKFGELVHNVADEFNEKQLASRTRTAEVEKRCGLALKDLAARLEDVEHNLSCHTHEFTSTKTYKCGLAVTPTSSMACGRAGLFQPDALSQTSTMEPEQ